VVLAGRRGSTYLRLVAMTQSEIERRLTKQGRDILALYGLVEQLRDSQNSRLDRIEALLEAHEGRFDHLEGRLDGLDSRFDRVDDTLTEILRRLPA
jgi:tetrahydromethanopterin S-methyltransferase subunit G